MPNFVKKSFKGISRLGADLLQKIPYFDDFGELQPVFLKPRWWNSGARGRTRDSLSTPNFVKTVEGVVL